MFKKALAVLALLLSTAVALAAVDVNKATEAELDSVKGIGPGTSKLILSERKKGEFKSWEDFIGRVKGVGEARATHLSEAGLTVGGKSYQPATASARKDAKSAAKEEKKDTKAQAKAEKKDTRTASAAKPAASAARK